MTYYVDFNNQTDRTWTMVVYQTLPDSVGLDSVGGKKRQSRKKVNLGLIGRLNILLLLLITNKLEG